MKQSTQWSNVVDATRRVMRGNRGKDTRSELTLRSTLHAMGYRFQLHRRDLPGNPDLVFPSRLTAIQVHGWFWHQHKGCRHANMPRTRPEYWLPKLRRNVERDREGEARLRAMGWRLLVVWECELANSAVVARRASEFLGPPRRMGHRLRMIQAIPQELGEVARA